MQSMSPHLDTKFISAMHSWEVFQLFYHMYDFFDVLTGEAASSSRRASFHG